MAISIAAFDWIVRVNDSIHSDLWNDLQPHLPAGNQRNARRVFSHHAAVTSVKDCLALSREPDNFFGELDEPAILDRLRRHYEDADFDAVTSKADADLAARAAYGSRR